MTESVWKRECEGPRARKKGSVKDRERVKKGACKNESAQKRERVGARVYKEYISESAQVRMTICFDEFFET